jgi:hypothetical protein
MFVFILLELSGLVTSFLTYIQLFIYIFLKESRGAEIVKLRKLLDTEASQKEKLEEEIAILKSQLLQMSLEAEEV